MRFFTRELYRAQQPDSGVPEDEARRAWMERCEELRLHMEAIRPRLSEAARSLSETTFHDGVIQSASQPSPDEVVLSIDASDNPWGPRGRFELIFRGVRRVSDLTALVGDYWLYEEIDLHPQAAFVFSVLLGSSELEVVADDVEIREHAD